MGGEGGPFLLCANAIRAIWDALKIPLLICAIRFLIIYPSGRGRDPTERMDMRTGDRDVHYLVNLVYVRCG